MIDSLVASHSLLNNMKSSQIFNLRYYVRPTALRMQKQYIIYYQTWTWVFSTGCLDRNRNITFLLGDIFRLHPIYHPCLPQYKNSDQSEELEISSECEIPQRK